MKKIALILLFSQSVFASPQITYEYTVPYTQAAKLTVFNKGQTPITITQLKFTTNALITAEIPYGSLWGWQSVLTRQGNPDGVHTDYQIDEKPAITIPAGSSADLIYQVDAKKNNGPLSPYHVAMNPVSVAIATEEISQPVALKIEGACEGNACIDPGNGKRIMGYYPNWAYWRDPKFTAEQLPYKKINTIAYAFSIFDENGNVSLYDQDSDALNIPIIAQFRQRYPYLNASLAFGGWSWASTPPGWLCSVGASPDGPAACFSKMAADPARVDNFVNKSVKAMKEVQFNGIDIDWEYPQSQESEHFVSLLQKLRAALDVQGEKDTTHYYLTVAVGAGVDKIQNLTAAQWQRVAEAVDYVDVMTYDFHGSWDQGQTGSNFMSAMQLDPQNDSTTNHPVLNKYNVTDAMSLYLSMGIPANKLVLGIPIYGRMMTIDKVGLTQGLYQTIIGTPQGEWDNQQSGFTGMIDYQCIVSGICGNRFTLPSLTLVDPNKETLGQYAKTPWGYSSSPVSGGALFITYDDAISAQYKANWIKQQNFAGAMFWDFTGDFAEDDSRSIVKKVHDIFNDASN